MEERYSYVSSQSDSDIKLYDPAVQKPVLRCSICTGEQVAGFKDIRTGKFTDIMLIRNEKDLQDFKNMYGITEIGKEF